MEHSMEGSAGQSTKDSAAVDSSLATGTQPTKSSLGMALLGGLLGGVVGFLIVNATHPVLPFEELPELGMNPSTELVQRHYAAVYAFHSGNGAVDCGILGGCLGFVIGLFTIRRRAVGAMVSGVAGLAIGALAGFVIGRFVANAFNISAAQSLAQSAFFHGTVWGLIGAAIGACVGLLNRSSATLNLAIFGLVGGVVGAIVFNVIAPIVAPASNLSILTPATALERIVWIGSAAIAIGLFVGLGLRDSQKPKQEKTAEA